MSIKCEDCGAELEPGVMECPICGCPVTTVQADKVTSPDVKVAKFTKINIFAIVSLLLGVIIIIMGITVMNKDTQLDTYSAKQYDADYVEFGGDFYTDIYGVTDTIVDELSDINGGIELLSESMATMANLIYYPVGMMIIAIGLGVVALSCLHIKNKDET